MKADINSIKENPHNPRTITEEKFRKLVKSLKEFPEMLEARPIVVDKDNIVLGGNMRLKAAREAGLTEVPIYRSEWSHDKSSEFIIKDNVGFGEWDWDLLGNEWDIYPLAEWGLDVWTPEEEVEGLTDPDEVPEVPADPITQLGDLWILGEHRLLCGDSTKSEDVERLMNGEKADMVFTDPPYGVDYEGGSKQRDGLISDERNTTIYQDVIPIISKHCFGACYVWYADKNPLGLYESVIKHGEIHSVLIWAKNNSTFNMNIHYKAKHEPCLYWKPKGATLKWKGSNTEDTVWNIDRDSANKLHPTQKPVILSERAINNHDANIVLDLFLGSGSTLIAAEKTGRKCYGMELDPKYCDVIVKRWEDYTGQKAVKG